MKGNLNFVKSEANASNSNTTAPVMFGATVYKFVLTVLYPNLCTICGKNKLTLCNDTPRQISIQIHAQAAGILNTFIASLKLNFR